MSNTGYCLGDRIMALLASQYSGCFFFQAEDGIRDLTVTGVQTCALPIFGIARAARRSCSRPDRLGRLGGHDPELGPGVEGRKLDLQPARELVLVRPDPGHRSEERRVGKEGRSRWSPYH